MGWFVRLLRGLRRRRIWILDGEGDFGCDVAGERYCQQALDRLAGGKTEYGHHLQRVADLLPDRGGGTDTGEVHVLIDNAKVGHLAKPHAAALIRALGIRGFQSARVDALIVGGWFQEGMRGRQGDYFVRLDLPLWILYDADPGKADPKPRTAPSARRAGLMSRAPTP